MHFPVLFKEIVTKRSPPKYLKISRKCPRFIELKFKKCKRIKNTKLKKNIFVMNLINFEMLH